MPVIQSGRFGVAAFDPETSISWHSLFWAEGTDFAAQGYSDTDPVGTWPNETSEKDATQATAGNKPLYVASESTLNNQPAVDWVDSNDALQTAAFTSNPTYPISIVIIGGFGVTGAFHTLIDGIGGSNRNNVGLSGTGTSWEIFAGTQRAGGTSDTSVHLFVAQFDGSTGNDTLAIDNAAAVINASAGSQTLTGVTLGNNNGSFLYSPEGPQAFFGIYEGDITADGSWDDFKTWVTDHYGITLA